MGVKLHDEPNHTFSPILEGDARRSGCRYFARMERLVLNRGRGIWIGGVLATGCLLCGCGERALPPPERPPAPVTVAAVTTRDVPVRVSAIGRVEPYSTVAVKSQVTGQLMRVHFREGQEIHSGALLFTVDPRSFESDLKRVEANLARDQAQLKQAEANLERDLALLKNAVTERDRYEQLVNKGVMARERSDQARTNAEAAEAAVAADRAAIQNAREAIQADFAAVENAKILLGYCSIRAPIGGRTGALMVYEGNVIKANETSLVVINQISPIYVGFSVPEAHLGEVKQRMAAGNLEVRAMPTGGSAESGRLSFIDNTVDASTGTILLKASFSNKRRTLWPGQFVDTVLTLDVEPGATVVPARAVQTGQNGTYVFVIGSDKTAEARPVKVSRIVDQDAVIEAGLRDGEKVVTDGHLGVVGGSKVEIKEAAPAPKGTGP